MKLENNWQSKSIEVLEKRSYGDAAATDVPVVKRILQMVKTPVGELTIEQLRLLIGQEIGLAYLVPLALVHLEKDILTEGDYYPGDLLEHLMGIDWDFWMTNPGLYTDLKNLIVKNRYVLADANIDTARFLDL